MTSRSKEVVANQGKQKSFAQSSLLYRHGRWRWEAWIKGIWDRLLMCNIHIQFLKDVCVFDFAAEFVQIPTGQKEINGHHEAN